MNLVLTICHIFIVTFLKLPKYIFNFIITEIMLNSNQFINTDGLIAYAKTDHTILYTIYHSELFDEPRGLALNIKAQRLFPSDKFMGVFFRLPTSQRIKGCLWK